MLTHANAWQSMRSTGVGYWCWLLRVPVLVCPTSIPPIYSYSVQLYRYRTSSTVDGRKQQAVPSNKNMLCLLATLDQVLTDSAGLSLLLAASYGSHARSARDGQQGGVFRERGHVGKVSGAG